MTLQQQRAQRLVIYSFVFLFTFAITLTAYINSSFLNTLVPEQFVGLVFSAGSVLSIFVVLFLPHVLRRFGLARIEQCILVLLIIASTILATTDNTILALVTFMVHFSLMAAFVIMHDILLEDSTNNDDTGGIRGTYLTVVNLAWLLGPFVAGRLVGEFDYWKAYGLSAIILTVGIFIFRRNFEGFKDPKYHKTSLWKAFRKITLADKNLARIFASTFLLKFFFAWMVIYSPIYLNSYVGLSWEEIGFIVAVTLMAYVLTERPLGKLADEVLGEKEILSLGFVIIVISTISLSFITSTSVFVWMSALFITRIGASMVEVTTESYFFKKINDTNLTLMSLFRTIRPWAYITGPIIASAFLLYFPLQYIFVALGAIMLYGLRFSLTLKDTK